MGKRKLLLGLVLLLLGAGAAALLLRPSAPDPMGSVGLITQPTALYSVYLDFEENAWTQEDRQFQAGQLSLALDWLREKGKEYGADLAITTQQEDPALARQASYDGPIGDGESPLVSEFDRWAQEVCRQLGEESDQERVGVLFFLPATGQSYTVVYKPEYGNDYYYEYSVIFQYRPCELEKQWPGPAVLAHEILHLFGAVDLYLGQQSLSQELAEQVTQRYPDEIMYTVYQEGKAVSLEEIPQQLSPFTAYRVGLTRDLEDLSDLEGLTAEPPGVWEPVSQP